MKIEFVLTKNENYNQKSKEIAAYFSNMKKSFVMILKEFNSFKQEILRYKMQNHHFFRNNSKNVFMRKIIDFMKDKFQIIQYLHDEFDYKKRGRIYRRIIDRYWWDNFHQEICQYVQICETCQRQSFIKTKESLHFIWIIYLWQRVEFNVIYM